jgi:dTDP-4-amino-4,6-dideoxygalactose transaminase
MNEQLAILGGRPVREREWPKWPRSDQGTLMAIQEVLESSRWAVSGAYDGRVCFERKFAQAFAEFNEIPYCTPTASGTSALTIALQALGVGRGHEVIVPGLTWVACASAVANIGAVPVLADIDPATLAISPECAAESVSSRTAAILVVHPFNSIADLDALTSLSCRFNIPLIEDCAQAHGARWRESRVGTFGDVGCFSMQQSKLLTAGEGGAAITADPLLYSRLEQLRCDGRLFAAQVRPGQLELAEVADVQGRNACLSELQAAVLSDRLAHLQSENDERAQQADYLSDQLAKIDGANPIERDPRVTYRTHYNYVMRVERDAFAGNSVDAIARALSVELNTPVNPVYVPLNRHRLLCPTKIPRGDMTDIEFARLDLTKYRLPEADRARETCITLTQPVFLDSKEGMNEIVAAIEKVRAEAGKLLRTSQTSSAQAF